MKVFPVRYKWNNGSVEGTYYIVADTVPQAEEIAYGCIAANIYPQPEANERRADEGRAVARVWVMESWAAETVSNQVGLLGTGSESYNAKAYAEYSRTQDTSVSTDFPRVSRRIEDPYLIARVAEFKRKTAIGEWPRCSTHGRSVTIGEEGAAAPWGPPGFAVMFTGCCDAALNGFSLFMDRTLGILPTTAASTWRPD